MRYTRVRWLIEKMKGGAGMGKLNNGDMEKGLGRRHQSKSGKMKNRSELQKWKIPEYLCKN